MAGNRAVGDNSRHGVSHGAPMGRAHSLSRELGLRASCRDPAARKWRDHSRYDELPRSGRRRLGRADSHQTTRARCLGRLSAWGPHPGRTGSGRSPLHADEDRFDINGNDVFDGTEAYAAYEHVLSGRCGGLDATGPGTNWFAGIVNDDNEVVQSWQDSPPLRLRLVPTGSPDASPGYARGQALRLNITGLVGGRGYSIYFESDPVLLTAVTADNAGTVTTDVTIPGDTEPGRHHIVVRESDGTEAARVAFDVNADTSPGPVVNIPIEGDETTTEPPTAGSAGFGS